MFISIIHLKPGFSKTSFVRWFLCCCQISMNQPSTTTLDGTARRQGIPAYGRGWKLPSGSAASPGINAPTAGACAAGISTGAGVDHWALGVSDHPRDVSHVSSESQAR